MFSDWSCDAVAGTEASPFTSESASAASCWRISRPDACEARRLAHHLPTAKASNSVEGAWADRGISQKTLWQLLISDMSAHPMSGSEAVGLLLDTEGVPLRFFSVGALSAECGQGPPDRSHRRHEESPLCENSRSRAPQASKVSAFACLQLFPLGSHHSPRRPKRYFTGFQGTQTDRSPHCYAIRQAAVQQSFESQGITLLQARWAYSDFWCCVVCSFVRDHRGSLGRCEVSLGPHEEVAHACTDLRHCSQGPWHVARLG